MKRVFTILLFCLSLCFGHSETKSLNLENLFKKSKRVYSVNSDEDIEKRKAEKARKEALLAQKQVEQNKITIIEVNINWSYVTFYYVLLISLAGFYIYTDYRKITK